MPNNYQNIDTKPAISIRNLVYSWPKASNPILSIPEWQVDSGQKAFLYGRSGSGKSTLLNIVTGILQVKRGIVEVDGEDLIALNARQKDRFRAQYMGIIFQQFNLIPYLSVADNIRLSQFFSRQVYDKARLISLVEQLDLDTTLLHQKARELSVGQQQRVAVARALYHRPKLIIADEPTSALDADTRDTFIRLLLNQCEVNNSTVLFVSHDKTLEHYFDHSINLLDINHAGGDVHAA